MCFSAFDLPEDQQYFYLFLQGDGRGLNYLEKRLRKYIFNYARKIMVNDFELNSIIQDAFLNAWDHRPHFNDIPHLLYYLKQYVRWACYKWFRKNKGMKIIPIELCDYQLGDTYDCTEIAELHTNEQSRWDLVEEATSYLPDSKRAIVELLKNGLSYASIARVHNTTPQHITVEIKKIIIHLKRLNDRLLKVAIAESARPKLMLADYRIYLNGQQCDIFKYYYEDARSLHQIAILLHITPFQLQQQLLCIKHIVNNKPRIK